MIVFPLRTSPTPLIESCGTVRTLGFAEHDSRSRAVTSGSLVCCCCFGPPKPGFDGLCCLRPGQGLL